MPSPEELHRDLVAWGFLDAFGPPVWSRRLRGAIMRAAAKLAEEERLGRPVPPNALEGALDAVLAAWELPVGAAFTGAHRRFLLAVELAARA